MGYRDVLAERHLGPNIVRITGVHAKLTSIHNKHYKSERVGKHGVDSFRNAAGDEPTRPACGVNPRHGCERTRLMGFRFVI